MTILFLSLLLGVFAVSTRILAATQAQSVFGTIRFEDGFFVYAKITPIEQFSDQFFTYWIGEAYGKYFIFDPFRKIWYPGPVQYVRTKLNFRGSPVEGFLRVWGRQNPYVDPSYFFGVDGAVYQNVRLYKRVGPYGRRHRRLRKSYYVNLLSGERSDMPPRTSEETQAYLELIKQIPKDAFPKWATPLPEGEQPPSTEKLPEGEEPTEELTPDLTITEPITEPSQSNAPSE